MRASSRMAGSYVQGELKKLYVRDRCKYTDDHCTWLQLLRSETFFLSAGVSPLQCLLQLRQKSRSGWRTSTSVLRWFAIHRSAHHRSSSPEDSCDIIQTTWMLSRPDIFCRICYASLERRLWTSTQLCGCLTVKQEHACTAKRSTLPRIFLLLHKM